MAYSSWFSRLRSSSRTIYANFRNPGFKTNHTNPINTTDVVTSTKPILSWSSSLLPLALAVSAGSLAIHVQTNPSLCDSFDVDARGVSVGGKGSTEFVVKGSHKDIPRELLDELKAICQVLYL